MKKIIKAILGYRYTLWVFKGKLRNGIPIYYGVVRPQEEYPNLKSEYPTPRWNTFDGVEWEYPYIYKRNIRRMADVEKYSPYKLKDWSM